MGNEGLCQTCGERPVYAKGECRRCYVYRRRTGEKRPEYLGCLTADQLVEAAADIANCGRSVYSVAQEIGCTPAVLRDALLGRTEMYADVAARLPKKRLLQVMEWYKKHRHGKLSPHEVWEMRKRRKAGALLIELAADYGINESQVSRLVRGLTYAEIGGPIAKTEDQI